MARGDTTIIAEQRFRIGLGVRQRVGRQRPWQRRIPNGLVVAMADVHEVLDRTNPEIRHGDALYVNLGRTERARSDIPGNAPTAGLSIDARAGWRASRLRWW